jgi:GT2 family glycosyltransferase
VALPHRNTNYSDTVLRSAPDNRRVWVDFTFTACAYAVRAEHFLKLGGFREYLFYMGEEADLSIRMLDRGFYTACAHCTPIEHMQPKGRSTRAADFYGRRNDILVDFLNIPAPLTAYHLARATLHGIVFGATNRKLGVSLRGLASGFGLSWKFRARRQPVDKRVFDRFERLRKEGPLPLDSLEPLRSQRIGSDVPAILAQAAKPVGPSKGDAVPTTDAAGSAAASPRAEDG